MSNISTRAIRSFTLGIGLAVSLLSASFAYAHATLVQSTPAANAVVASPQQIDLMFNETLVPRASRLELAMIHGNSTMPIEHLEIEPGEILVCGMTTPAWCVAISVSAGLISTGGGDCCHSAIAAREFAIPAVVGVATAMDALRTGDMVTLDGTTGVVTLQRD